MRDAAQNGPQGDAGRGAFFWPVRVYYEDTDAGGVVYYANYLKFLERARTEWLRALGFEQQSLREDHGVVFVVRRLELAYRRAARFDEALEVESSVLRAGRAGLDFSQTVWLAGEPRVACVSGTVALACVGIDDFRPRPIPRPLLTEIRVER